MLSIIENKQQELLELCHKYFVKRLDLFGSATGDEFDPQKSDIDFLVEFEASTPIGHADRYFGLLASLRDLFSRKVDLVEYKAIKNPYFKKSVDSSRVTVYET